MRNYSKISHIIRSKKNPSKVIGYILLKDTEVLNDPNEIFLTPVKEVSYIKVELETTIDLTNDSIDEGVDATKNLVTDSNTTAQVVAINASTAEPNAAILDANDEMMAEVNSIVQSKKGITLS